MEIRRLKQEEILDALHLSWEVFAQCVAPLYTREGVEEFQKFIRYENMMELYRRREICFFGSYENGQLVGCIAANPSGHIKLLFVRKEYQHQNIGLQLIGYLKLYAAETMRVSILTVNAAPSAVGFYQRAGFCVTGAASNVHGIVSVPMESLIMNPGSVGNQEEVKRRRNRNIIIGTVAGAVVVVLAVLMLCILMVVGRRHGINTYDRHNGYNGGQGYEEPYPEYGGDTAEEEASGIENIDSYEADDVKYTVKDQSYRERSGKGTNYIEFNVNYPEISGLDSGKEKEINEIIKNCAMKTVDEIYTHPSEEMKEKILGSPNAYLVSSVEYKICYQSNDFMSIVFNDECYKGTEYGGIELRAVNVSLKTGETYDIKDIVTLDSSFMEAWLASMKGEAPEAEIFSEVSLEDFKKILEGDTMDQKYSNVFFVDENGIEIGLSILYRQGEQYENRHFAYGWITGPFSFQEMNRYKTDSSFWNLVGDH